MPATIPTTENPAHGFFGTIRHHADPDTTWALALPAIAAATHSPEAAVRAFLDSRHGRHFADEVVNNLFAGQHLRAAVESTVARWMTWTISRRTQREIGIPRDLPYLTGFVLHHAIETEDAA